ncbi:MAG: RagB/SusD family nutrient uptake outer membrane protein [Bacteroidota bacterium]
MKKINLLQWTFSMVLVVFAIGFSACTDLDDVVEDGLREEVVDRETLPLPSDPAAALQTAYNQLNGFTDQTGLFAMMEHTSDELIGPTRGTDWSDFGVWRQLHSHQWSNDHRDVVDEFRDISAAYFQATQVIAATTDVSLLAQARFLRGFFMMYMVDLFGQVPFREATEGAAILPRVISRADATTMVIEDLEFAIANLPDFEDGIIGRASKQAAEAVLMKVLLNKGVWTADNPAGPYNFEDADMDRVISLADDIESSGFFALEPAGEYFDIFSPDNTTNSDEPIFGITNDVGNNRGNTRNRVYMTVHYNQNPSGWNGFSTLSGFYNKFDQDDERLGTDYPGVTDESGLRAGFLIGQQFDQDGTALTDRAGAPLAFTPEVDLLYSNEVNGIRVIKYTPDYGDLENPGNDYVFVRYADVVLMAAEAHLRKGENADALALVNEIRGNRGVDDLTSIDEMTLLDERGFELYWEGWRRQDQIRFGTFLGTWDAKPEASPEAALLFPIPLVQLNVNSNLRQNPGYN